MSDGKVCQCGHYFDHHNERGRCDFEWHGKTCDCKVFREDLHMAEFRALFTQ